MKHTLTKNLVVLTITLIGFSQLAQAEQFTQVQALKVLNVLMGSKEITNTYGGKYSEVTQKTNETTLQVYKTGGKFEISLQQNAPSINIDEILVDGVALRTRLSK